jgi:uncharacterized protein with ATP-grasp and redox domains
LNRHSTIPFPACPENGNVFLYRRAAAEADRILYLADNAGEIVFDRLLIEALGSRRITLSVRGSPVLNDATIEDAKTAGLYDMVDVIENGSDAPGTILEECNDELRKCYQKADLIIAKGQGNFETLSRETRNIYFLFKVKCAVIASHVHEKIGTHVLFKAGAAI